MGKSAIKSAGKAKKDVLTTVKAAAITKTGTPKTKSKEIAKKAAVVAAKPKVVAKKADKKKAPTPDSESDSDDSSDGPDSGSGSSDSDSEAEIKKPVVKKADAKKPETKKPEVKKVDAKKPEAKKPEVKKVTKVEPASDSSDTDSDSDSDASMKDAPVAKKDASSDSDSSDSDSEDEKPAVKKAAPAAAANGVKKEVAKKVCSQLHCFCLGSILKFSFPSRPIPIPIPTPIPIRLTLGLMKSPRSQRLLLLPLGPIRTLILSRVPSLIHRIPRSARPMRSPFLLPKRPRLRNPLPKTKTRRTFSSAPCHGTSMRTGSGVNSSPSVIYLPFVSSQTVPLASPRGIFHSSSILMLIVLTFYRHSFGYVEYENASSAKAALEAKNGTELDGRNLNIDYSTPRPEAAPRQDRAKTYGDQKSPESDTVFVANLSFDADEATLQAEFESFGNIIGLRLPTDP